MSFDVKFEAFCDHRTHLETHDAESDRRTVKLPQPASRGNFRTYMNGFLLDKNNSTYGWRLVKDPDGHTEDFLMLQFKNKLPSGDDVFQMSYTTSESNCRRCHGLRIYHDMSLDTQGKLRIVVDEAKLLQDAEKGIFTVRGSNRYAAWYGTGIISLVGAKVVQANFIQLRVQREIAQFLAKMRKMQVKQAEFQGVTLKELFSQIRGVQVSSRDAAGTTWDVLIRIQAQSGSEVEFVKPLELYNSPAVSVDATS